MPTPSKVDPRDLIGLREIGELLGVPSNTTWRWRSRHVLPIPVATCSGVPVWTRPMILAWAQRTGRLPTTDATAGAAGSPREPVTA